MAGSYDHVVTGGKGQLVSPARFRNMIENLGDAYEAVEEMYGMIWLLADGDAGKVAEAEQMYRLGLEMSPGVERG